MFWKKVFWTSFNNEKYWINFSPFQKLINIIKSTKIQSSQTLRANPSINRAQIINITIQ